MASGDDTVEHTLYIGREVTLYTIPPRPGAGGHKSGDWKTADKIFAGRLRCVATGENCEVRVEDPNTGELYVTTPVPLGQRSVAVEPVSDSSRYFVLRVVDPTSNRHVFLGLGFTERGDAFDFNVALSDHEKQVHRAREAQEAAASGKAGQPVTSLAAGDVASLYKKQDLSLKEGETIKIAMKKPANSSGFLSSLPASGGTGLSLPPPPGGGSSFGLAPPPASTSSQGGYGGNSNTTSSPVQLTAPAQPLQSPTQSFGAGDARSSICK
ncbi:hypothetical protein WJX84_008397 [Apatococcus fuscideae]|uniref:NECAP PHear domain-containing protein n=1 Tax=Apatococcus fuscideae TaxID=2026836 RepID=A0AAW1STR1_9CHLO